MKIAAGGGKARVAQSGLHKVDWSATVQDMRGMRVAQPVRRDLLFYFRPLRRLPHNAMHRVRPQVPALFSRSEDGVLWSGFAPQAE